MKPTWCWCVAATLVTLGGCAHGSADALLGKWTNHHVAPKQPAIVSIEFLPKNTVTITVVDALAAAGWHRQATSSGQYELIALDKVKVTEELGSAVLDYHIDGAQLVLSGDGLAQLLGRAEPPQTLDRTSQ